MKPNVRVLIVDDEAGTRAALKSLLETEGYAVDQAGDGAAALERLVEQPPDLVVTDLSMPNMNGLQLCRRLRAIWNRGCYQDSASTGLVSNR